MAKKKVELICGSRREFFEESHASRILKMRNNGGWKLAPKKKPKNDIKPRADKGTSKVKGKEHDD